jgi:hypothetical protein
VIFLFSSLGFIFELIQSLKIRTNENIQLLFSAAFLMWTGNVQAQVSLVQDLYPGTDGGLYEWKNFKYCEY